MMKAVILVCAFGMARPDCSVETATNVIQGPEANALAQCGLLGHAHPASAQLVGYLDGDNYVKIVCDGDGPYKAPLGIRGTVGR
ncbi:MAG: hypothetical protein AAGA73_16955 [Pseudomonadota bacterium]